LSRQILAGHNVFALLNDDILIEANVKAGKKIEDCRLYGAGGCQETILEGFEHSAGAYYYFNLPKMLDFCLHPHLELQGAFEIMKILPPTVANCSSFEDFYSIVLNYILEMVTQGADMRCKGGTAWPEVNPCPFFSASIDDCLKNRKDYTEGGGRYNPSGISLVGFGTLVDSLFTVKKAVFEEKWLTLDELSAVLAKNWKGNEPLRQKIINLPKYGHGKDEVDTLAAKIADDLYKTCSQLTNERGGLCQLSFFVYYFFVGLSEKTLATPDGRQHYEMYSQGISPGRLRPADSLTDSIHTLNKIDFSNYPGNAVLDVQLPMGKMKEDLLTAYLKVFSASKTPTIQCSCVDVSTLKAAQKYPENHQDLMVRISGLSAKFIALTKDVQDEIISRNLMS
jgi:formate C-acetyltransferase